MCRTTMLLVCGVISLGLSGCGSDQPSIVGELETYGSYPIAGRKIALCRITGGQVSEGVPTSTPLECSLLDAVAVSDEKGHFEFKDVPPGSYLLLYDSGLSDFNAAVQKWAGRTLRIGDQDWLLDSLIENRQPQIPMFSELANVMALQGGAKTQEYMALHLMVGDSPFILAHDVDKMMRKGEISIVVAVAGEGGQTVRFPALYLKK